MTFPRSSRQWQHLRLQVLHRDGWQCTRCGSRQRLEVDHVVPLADGGTDDKDNLRTLCRACHVAETRGRWRTHQVDGQADWEAAMRTPRSRRDAGL